MTNYSENYDRFEIKRRDVRDIVNDMIFDIDKLYYYLNYLPWDSYQQILNIDNCRNALKIARDYLALY